MSPSAYNRYAHFIQEYIYRKGWDDLRDVQKDACSAILDSNDHVIIASGTASGKTEAAFFPVLTMLEKDMPASVGVLYIGPLKALINDQFQRLGGLLKEQDIPVWPWHGDISQYQKEKAIKKPRGILQITPESLESLIMKNASIVKKLFSDLRFVIIDEIHAFMGEDRGLQLICLLTRLERLTGCSPRRIGLSATLHDYRSAKQFLAAGTNRKVNVVGLHHRSRKLSLAVQTYVHSNDPKEDAQIQREQQRFLYNHCHKQKCIIFTNSRKDAELVVYQMKEMAAKRDEPDVFYAHHGSISTALRKDAEQALRNNDGPTVAAATLSLELGIDIGELDMTVQIGAPPRAHLLYSVLGDLDDVPDYRECFLLKPVIGQIPLHLHNCRGNYCKR